MDFGEIDHYFGIVILESVSFGLCGIDNALIRRDLFPFAIIIHLFGIVGMQMCGYTYILEELRQILGFLLYFLRKLG